MTTLSLDGQSCGQIVGLILTIAGLEVPLSFIVTLFSGIKLTNAAYGHNRALTVWHTSWRNIWYCNKEVLSR